MVRCDKCKDMMIVKKGEFNNSYIYLWYSCTKCKHSLLIKFVNKWSRENNSLQKEKKEV